MNRMSGSSCIVSPRVLLVICMFFIVSVISCQPNAIPDPEARVIKELSNIAHSPDYDRAIANLSKIEDDSGQIGTFIKGLPDPPLLPFGARDVEFAVQNAKKLRGFLSSLPPLPAFPPPPPAAAELQRQKNNILQVSQFVETLEPLPQFMSGTGSLSDIKRRSQEYADTTKASSNKTKALLLKIRSLTESSGKRLADFRQVTQSEEYSQVLGQLDEQQRNARDIERFLNGLPRLPSFPSGLTAGDVDKAVQTAKAVRPLISALPPLPPFTPELAALEQSRQLFLTLTPFVEKLASLPDFLKSADGFEGVKARLIKHTGDVQTTSSQAKDLLETIKSTAVSAP